MLAVVLVVVACGGGANSTTFTDAGEPICDWRHRDGCEPCSDRRDYGAGNTCEDLVWRGRTPTDFCMQTYPCNYTPPPVTRIDGGH